MTAVEKFDSKPQNGNLEVMPKKSADQKSNAFYESVSFMSTSTETTQLNLSEKVEQQKEWYRLVWLM